MSNTPGCASEAQKSTMSTVLPGPAVLLWHPPRICCGGTAHRTGPALLCSQGYDNLSWCLWFFGDTDDRWIPRTQKKQIRHLRWQFRLGAGGEEAFNKISLAASSAYPETESHLASLNQDCFNTASSVCGNHFPWVLSLRYYSCSRAKAS